MNDNLTYILLSRSILDSEVFANQKLLKIWIWCLVKANYKDRNVPLKVGKGIRTVKVKRGSFIFGRMKAEDELFIDGSTIYKAIKKLEQIGNISIKSNNQYSIITILNYDTYQNIKTYQVAANEQPMSSQVAAKGQPKDTDNTLNKDKHIKESKELFDKIRNLYPGTKRGFETEYENFKKKHKDWKEILPLMYDQLNNQINIRKQSTGFVPYWANFSTWINQRKFEEILTVKQENNIGAVYTPPKRLINKH